MPSPLRLVVGIAMVLSLAACSAISTPGSTSPTAVPDPTTVEDASPPTETQPADSGNRTASEPGSQPANPAEGMARQDAQGAITVEVTPLTLDGSQETLVFEVSMNTHSVDLSMDLTALATLSTDTGKSVQPVKWDGDRGGHHVSGTLSFPAQVDGAALLEGATTLTLVLEDVDAPERVFTWEIAP